MRKPSQMLIDIPYDTERVAKAIAASKHRSADEPIGTERMPAWKHYVFAAAAAIRAMDA